MMSQTLQCPQCKSQVTIQGNPGETILLSCTNCNTKGKYIFPGNLSPRRINNNSNVIEVKNLTKNFKGFIALYNVSFTIKKGEITGFVGPNGSGKTTTIKLIMNLLTPTSGNVYINNMDVIKYPTKALLSVGSLIEVPGVYDYLTPHEMLKYFAQVHKINKNEINQKIKETLKIVKLTEWEHKKIRSFSTGMQRRLAIAKAILHSPELLILDEPVIGLDPKGIKDIRDMLKQLKSKGVTIFLSSHLLDEVGMICDRIIFLDGGQIVTQQTIDEIKNKTKIDTIEVEFLEELTDANITKIKNISEIIRFDKENGFFTIRFDGKPETSNLILTKLVKQGLKVFSFSTKKGDLESYYISIMNDEKGVM